MSYSITKSESFTLVHARKLASKVAADMHLCAQYYGNPSEASIRDYAEELAQYLNAGYIAEYEFGFKKNGKRVVTWRYIVDEYGQIATDDRAGKVVPYVDTAGAVFFNYLTQNSRFFQLPLEQQTRFKDGLSVKRTSGDPPADGEGSWTSDRSYSAGGRGLNRQTFQPN